MTPFVEAQDFYQNSPKEILDPINSLVPLVHEICAIRNDRNELIHEIATILGHREHQLIDDSTYLREAHDITFEEMKIGAIAQRQIQENQISEIKAKLTNWYGLLMRAINEAYIFEHHRRKFP